ncbi:hypothetical protein VD0002_g3641 [Verticillium dahliae]|nr:hypothetical protein BJF96_g4495 [Verticillium dahliae]PNH65358.1 hypothetical protein VD0002_g3641 [Verticillium dahliae]
MTAAAPVRASTPRPKAAATTSTSSHAATAPAAAASAFTSRPGAPPPAAPRPPPPFVPVTRRSKRPLSTDFLSDDATAAFVRRVLCPQHQAGNGTPPPLEDLLPPLTSRNDVDLQLYALLAVILRDFVQAWYSKITSDETFVAEILQIIAHCTRALEQRLRKVDLESLLLDELPDLLDNHITAYRTAHNPVARPPTQVNPRDIYHALCPLVPLSPVPKPEDPESAAKQQENETMYRQLLVQGVLAILLPTEDLENECLTALVGQILSELIIGNVFINKLAQPWMLWEIMIILVRVLGKREPEKTTLEEGVAEALSPDAPIIEPESSTRGWSFQGIFWGVIQWLFMAFTVVQLVVLTLASSSSLPARSTPALDAKHSLAGSGSATKAAKANASKPVKAPIVTFKLWSCISSLIELDARTPWLSGALSMLQFGAVSGPAKLAGLDGPLDRLLSHAIHSRLLDSSHLPTLLRATRGALFPNNAQGVSSLTPPADESQLRALRRRCASALLALVPRWLSRFYLSGRGLGLRSRTVPSRGLSGRGELATAREEGERDVGTSGGQASTEEREESEEDRAAEEERVLSEIEEGILDVFSDEYCNRHLMYGILELILVRLMPELAEKGVAELWDERLS